MDKIIDLLDELMCNCGDIIGRDGTYLDTQVAKIIEVAKKIDTKEKSEK